MQEYAAQTAREELSRLLGTPVEIGRVKFSPFNRLVVEDVTVMDSHGREALHIGQLGAGISLFESIGRSRLAINYAEILDLSLNLYRSTPSSPLNIDTILERFKSKPAGPSARFDFSINTVVIRRSSFSYDVLSAPDPSDGEFSKHHIALQDLCADLTCKRASNTLIDASVRRLSASDRSGLTLSNLSVSARIDTVSMEIEGLRIKLSDSELSFGNITFPSPLVGGFNTKPIVTDFSLSQGSYVSITDLTHLLPAVKGVNTTIELAVNGKITGRHLTVNNLSFATSGKEFQLEASGAIEDIRDSIPELIFDRLDLITDIPATLTLLGSAYNKGIKELSSRLSGLKPLGHVILDGELRLRSNAIDFDGALKTSCGNISVEGGVERLDRGAIATRGSFESLNFNPSPLIKELEPLATITGDGKFDLLIRPGAIAATYSHGKKTGLYGDVNLAIREAVWRETTYREIGAELTFNGEHVDAVVDSHVPYLSFTLEGSTDLYSENALTEIHADIRHIMMSPLITGPYADLNISGEIDTRFSGSNINDINGELVTRDLTLTLPTRRLYIHRLEAESTADETYHSFHLNSSLVNMSLTGHYTYDGLLKSVRNSLAETLPALIPKDNSPESGRNLNARLEARFVPDTTLTSFFRLPLEMIDTVNITGSFNPFRSTLSIYAPYLAKKNKIIEQTRLRATIVPGASGLTATTTLPSKKGPLTLSIASDARYNTIGSMLDWKIDTKGKRYMGNIDVGARFVRDSTTHKLSTSVNINPSDLIINDTVWNLSPAHLDVTRNRIDVDGFSIGRPNERLSINGIASADSLQALVVDLKNINLDYLFSTLDLGPNVNFGGIASGKINALGVLSRQPYLYIPTLNVTNFTYNTCVMGDAAIRSWWNNDDKAIYISADVENHDGGRALVAGYINPVNEAIDLRFDARRAPVGFMQRFMSAFASEVTGHASGILRLYGTLSKIDLEGDVLAQNLGLKLAFTNVAYNVTDSIRIRPGEIVIDKVTMRDSYKNTAVLSGRLSHDFFHNPVFDFSVTNANKLLLYDISRRQSADPWYGKVFGSGKANVKGWPGMVDIGVNVTTTAGSRFTLVLDDKEEASDYAFVTLRDRDAALKDSLRALADTIPQSVKEIRQRLNKQFAEQPTDYKMNFDINITPDATLTLIMDPVARDSITAKGSGEMKMAYNSAGDLMLRGDYSIDRGTYIFTMQDVIEKKFNIRQGSSVVFNGNPYAAKLDITAAYPVKANLSDLDESFLHDGELQNTNINFNALLKVTGDMRAPDIKFDLEFPTSVTSDVDRKVRSIISTDEMMERQMIYLLALNRFYTPDYMNGTRGNELVSVASSTISSRLSSMLGQLSDNWSIAPAFRSSKGDFSDVEVDLGLSSHLLNNRLLLNGNLGYRDKALNNNSFIGDFDVRYLLNRTGTIQLKAYNRYNDQNYYLKSALTTQGIGVMFRRDFDTWLSFFRRKKKESTSKDIKPEEVDTTGKTAEEGDD